MKLKRQLYIAFIMVAVLPLIVVALYLYSTNMRLAADLYKQNLCNSTELQTDVLDESIRRFKVQAMQFARSKEIKTYFSAADKADIPIEQDIRMSEELYKFTDNTLDHITTFAITDKAGDILYHSGSNTDGRMLLEIRDEIPPTSKQSIYEMPWGEAEHALVMVTPIVGENSTVYGALICVYNSDYLIKSISGRRQIASSNSFIYCAGHNTIVKTKKEITGSLQELPEHIKIGGDGVFEGNIGDEKNIFSYRRILGTQWVLVNSIPAKQVKSFVFSYAIMGLFLVALSVCAIVIISGRLSQRILLPLNRLLDNVERFFLSNAKTFTAQEIDSRTEIGYLNEKFTGMAAQIAGDQAKLNESNYLYETLLYARYEMRIVVDFKNDTITSSNARLSDWLFALGEMSSSEKLVYFFEQALPVAGEGSLEIIQKIVNKNLSDPQEIEACFDEDGYNNAHWYRIIAVPIIDEKNITSKTVMHFENITDKKREELRLLKSSQRDGLSGLLNKQALLEISQKYINSVNAKSTTFFIDVDNFKNINDTFGHAAGDTVIVNIAKVLTDVFNGTNWVARYGGDEFVAVVPGMNREAATHKAQELLKALDMDINSGHENSLHITASIGVYVACGAHDVQELIKCADKAMYKAKQNGKMQFCMLEDTGCLQ